MFDSYGGGLTKKQLSANRNKYSDYLPYIAYDPKTHCYLNTDDTCGFIWECTPLYFSDKNVAKTIDGMLKLSYPEGSVMQFILYADPYVKPFLDTYKSLTATEEPILKRTVDSFSNYLEQGVAGLSNIGGTPIRNFKLYVTLKMPCSHGIFDKEDLNKLELIRSSVHDFLRGALLHPTLMPPEELINTLYRIFTTRLDINIPYNDEIPIRKQIIPAECTIEDYKDRMKIGDKYMRIITPKAMPKELNLIASNLTTGGIWGMESDSSQIGSPFIITYNIVLQSLKAEIHKKCSLMLQQKGFGSFASALERKKEEHLWAVDMMEGGSAFYRIIPVVIILGRSESETVESMVRSKRLWEQQGFVMQEDRGILPIMFLASLPFGLYNIKDNVKVLERDFILPTSAIAELLPIQSDFTGGAEKPYLVYVGRKGQLISLDFYDKSAPNQNAFVAAGSGGGKSFMVNNIAINYRRGGALIRVIDIGGSYEKAIDTCGGKARYLEFTPDADICINPFSTITDVKEDLSVISAIIGQMAYSSSGGIPTETEASLIKKAVKWAYDKKETDANIDTVYRYLSTYPTEAGDDAIESLKDTARLLAFNMQEFTSKGVFSKWFNGKATFNIEDDEFVVLELEHIKKKKELFSVVTLQVLNAVTQGLYLGKDRSQKQLIIFDEAWQFLGDSGFLKTVIEEGYRKARKYGGSFTTITQSFLDLKRFGVVGEVIKANSAFKFYLQSNDFEEARHQKVLDMPDFSFELLKSVRKNGSKYSEIFFDTPMGIGVGRLVVDEFSALVYNSSPDVNSMLKKLREQGKTNIEALEYMMTMKQ